MLKLATTMFLSLLVAACGVQSPATAPEATPVPAATSAKESSAVSIRTRHAAEPIVDVPKIAGKSLTEVSTVLGKPTSCETIKYGKKCFFEVAGTEVVFIAGKADWITVNALDKVPYSADALPFLGFEKSSPAFSNEHVIRWENIPGFLEVSINPGEAGSIFYAYIKTATP